jgi:hypothetical protein
LKKLIALFVWATASCVFSHFVTPYWVWSVGWASGLLAGAVYMGVIEWEYERRKEQQASEAGESK